MFLYLTVKSSIVKYVRCFGDIKKTQNCLEVCPTQVGYKFRGSIFKSEEKNTQAVFIG